MNYNDSYLGNNFNAWSQAANAFTGGHADVSISARIGEKNLYDKVNWFWRSAMWIVDNTFYPVDGKGHCYNAYLNDSYEDYQSNRLPKQLQVFGLYMVACIVVLFCSILAPIFWSYELIKKIF